MLLGMRSAKCRHQSPQWMILSHVNCFIQGEVTGFRPCWIVFIHIVRGRPAGFLQFSKREAVNIFLASSSSCICATWPNGEKCRAWTIPERCGCLVVHLISSFTQWYHMIPKQRLQTQTEVRRNWMQHLRRRHGVKRKQENSWSFPNGYTSQK